MDELEKLEKELQNYKRKQEKSSFSENTAIFVAAEIVAGILTSGFIGYLLDRYLSTKIFFLLIFTILGLISSLYNIYKKYK